jgi:hypothetical protein
VECWLSVDGHAELAAEIETLLRDCLRPDTES